MAEKGIIKSLHVEGLNNRSTPIVLHFHNDLNILTGKNGSNKTTILKIIWYLNSGDFLNLVKEITFSEIILETEKYRIKVVDNKDGVLKISLNKNDKMQPVNIS